MKLLENKTALITGAARGIGKSIALKFAAHGANIAFTDIRRDEHMEILEKELIGMGIKAKGYASDASSLTTTETTVEEILKDFGTVEVVVNNAGITRDNLLMRMTEEQWDMVINVNLKSIFNVTRTMLKPLMKQRYGSIINMGSVVGLSGNAGQSNYAASKSGLFGFTKSIAQEIGSRNIRVNAIAPGFILTEMTAHLPEEVKTGWAEKIPLRRAGTPEDVANLCLFLASDLSNYITGQVISVDGGMHM